MAREGCTFGALARARGRVRARRKVVVVAAAALVMMAGVCSPARASSVPQQGVYEYCAPAVSADACVARLRGIAAGGFRVVLNYAALDATRDQLETYMQASAALGVKLIWPMKDRPWWGSGPLALTYPALAGGCGCATDKAFLRYVVDLVKRSPATWGYYVADEQAPVDARRVAAFSRQLHALDPRHPRLAVAAGDDTVASLLAPYAAAADVVGADSYPVGTGQPLDRVGFVSRAVRAVATAHHRRSAMVLQAFDWSSYPDVGPWPDPRWPTSTEMRRMRDLAIRTARPSLILWYSYFNLVQAADAQERWQDLVWSAFG